MLKNLLLSSRFIHKTKPCSSVIVRAICYTVRLYVSLEMTCRKLMSTAILLL